MEVGFETIANACLIAYDRTPVLVTDPWIRGGAYFGSWALSHEVPPAQMEAATSCPYVWFSHGHPDHLNSDSLDLFAGKTILLPDHHGGRIKADLEGMGFTVRVLADRAWVRLSDRIRVLSIADYNQDAVLLVDINGRLVVNLNDAFDKGWASFVRRTVEEFPTSFLLSLSGCIDVDMFHFQDEQGNLLTPSGLDRFPIGPNIARKTESFGCTYFIPFSSMHRYQRTDSVWANQYATGLEHYAQGFASDTARILPAYVSYDCARDTWTAIEPAPISAAPVDPSVFGDDWSEPLDAGDVRDLTGYFQAIQALSGTMDFVAFRVGGKETTVPLSARGFNRGLTFDVPRGSLMTAVRYRVFDDLLIGNFMKTTMHGKWPASRLYPDFTPWVTKYADNGNARTPEELHDYFAAYQRRAPIDYLKHQIERLSLDVFRSWVSDQSPAFKVAKRYYWTIKKMAA